MSRARAAPADVLPWQQERAVLAVVAVFSAVRCFFGRSAGGFLVILALRTVRFGRFGGPSPGTSGSGGTGRFLPRRRRGSQNGLFSRNWQRRRAVFAAIGTLTSVGTLTVFPRSGRFRVPVRVFGRFFAAIGTLTSFVRYSYLVICLVIYALVICLGAGDTHT